MTTNIEENKRDRKEHRREKETNWRKRHEIRKRKR
jgi:hypothetical protein